MKVFLINQGERWQRTYRIEADTAEAALAEYQRLSMEYDDGMEADAERPEYVEDILDDVTVEESPAP